MDNTNSYVELQRLMYYTRFMDITKTLSKHVAERSRYNCSCGSTWGVVTTYESLLTTFTCENCLNAEVGISKRPVNPIETTDFYKLNAAWHLNKLKNAKRSMDKHDLSQIK